MQGIYPDTIIVVVGDEVVLHDQAQSLVSSGDQGPSGVPGLKGDQGVRGEKGDPGVVDDYVIYPDPSLLFENNLL